MKTPALVAVASALSLGLVLSGCAESPARLNARRGAGMRKVIDGSPSEVIGAFSGAFHGNVTRQGDDAVFGAMVGVSWALFIYPDSTKVKTDAEVLISAPTLDASEVINGERDMLNSFGETIKKKRQDALALKGEAAQGDSTTAAGRDDTKEKGEAGDSAPAPAFHSDVEAPSFQLPEDDKKFALVVGVENYQSIPKAEYAVRDASAVQAYLKAEGYPERNIVFLTDQQAGKSSLEKYLEA